jgi:hypothetical protein
MGQKRYTPEQIIGKLRQAEVRSAEGATVAEFMREPGIVRRLVRRGCAVICASRNRVEGNRHKCTDERCRGGMTIAGGRIQF